MNRQKLLTFIGLTIALISSVPAFAQMLYVTDLGDNTVKKITPDGVVSTFISSGLNSPIGLVWDTQGNLYVSNAGSNSISKYNSAGIQQTFSLSGAPLRNPFGLNISPSGNLYAVSFAANGIDTLISQVTSAGIVSVFAADEGTSSAFDLTFDSAGNLYTGSYNNSTVSKYNSAGVLQPFPLSGEALAGPQGLTRDGLGNLYVANTDNNTLSKITPGGLVSTFVDGVGLNGPADIERDSSGSFLVINAFDSTISKYSSAGVQQSFLLSGEPLLFPSLMAFAPAAAPEPSAVVLFTLSLLPLAATLAWRKTNRAAQERSTS